MRVCVVNGDKQVKDQRVTLCEQPCCLLCGCSPIKLDIMKPITHVSTHGNRSVIAEIVINHAVNQSLRVFVPDVGVK